MNCKKFFKNFILEEDGAGVVEVIIVLAILIALALLFRKQLTSIAARLFSSINADISNIDVQQTIPTIPESR